jgi:ribose transport system substrate-binding protein
MFGANRKFHVLALVALLLLALVVVVAAGCGSSSTTTTTAAATTTTAAAATTTTAAAGTTTTAAGATTADTVQPSTVGAGKTIIFETEMYAGSSAAREQDDTVQKFLQSQGYTCTIQDAGGSADVLTTNWQNAITQKPAAIINGGVLPTELGGVLDAAKAAGIPVFSQQATYDPREVCNVTSSDTAGGTASAEFLAKTINYTGNIVLFDQTDNQGIIDRTTAAKAVFAKYPNIKILQEVRPPGMTGLDSTKTDFTDILTANPTPGSIVGVWCAWGDPGTGASEAAQALKRYEVKISSYDATAANMQQMLLPNANMIDSYHQDWQGIAAKQVQLINDYLSKGIKPDQTEYQVPGNLISTPAEAQARIDFLKAGNYT